MTLDEQDALLDRLTALAEYYEKPKSPGTLALYVQELNDLPFSAISAALKHHVNHGFPLFPKVTEIRAIVEGEGDGPADVAWRELHAEFRRVGSWLAPSLSPTTEAVVRQLCGTWERACALIGQCDGGPELQGWQNKFREAYQAQSTRERLALPVSPHRPTLQLVQSRAPVVDGDT